MIIEGKEETDNGLSNQESHNKYELTQQETTLGQRGGR